MKMKPTKIEELSFLDIRLNVNEGLVNFMNIEKLREVLVRHERCDTLGCDYSNEEYFKIAKEWFFEFIMVNEEVKENLLNEDKEDQIKEFPIKLKNIKVEVFHHWDERFKKTLKGKNSFSNVIKYLDEEGRERVIDLLDNSDTYANIEGQSLLHSMVSIHKMFKALSKEPVETVGSLMLSILVMMDDISERHNVGMIFPFVLPQMLLRETTIKHI